MRLDHIAQQTADISAAVDWYRATFDDVEVAYRDDTWALLHVAGARIALVVPEQHPPHVAWRVDADELDAASRRHGVRIAPHRDGSRSIYLHGPDGVAVELVSYPADPE